MPRIIFMGTPDFSVPILTMLLEEQYHVVAVVTQPDRPQGRKKRVIPTPVKEVAQKYHLPLLQPEKLREPDVIHKIAQLNPDLIVTAAYGQILPQAILDIPRHGCINVHASLLPKYRGGAPIHRAIVAGEKETGITIMYMVKAMDAGDILSQRKIPILDTDTAGMMYDKLSHLGTSLLKEMLPSLLRGELTAIPQNAEQVTYAYNVTREDELIDWNRSARQVYNQVRGLHPWPVAYTLWNGEPLKIWWAEISDETSTEIPGIVTDIRKDGIEIATGRGCIIAREVQPSGRKRMSAAEFIRRGQLHIGEKLG